MLSGGSTGIVSKIYDTGAVVEDLVLDSDRRLLYWTANDIGAVVRFNLSQPNAVADVIVSAPNSSPRALVLDTNLGLAMFCYILCFWVKDFFCQQKRLILEASQLSLMFLE